VNIVLQSTFLLIFSFLSSLPVSAMNQMLAVRSSVPFTVMRPILTRSIVNIPQKRTLYGCTCIANFKGEISGDDSDIINERSERWECVRKLMQHKEQFEQEGKWPALTGRALEREFNSKQYCPKFKSCADRVNAKESRADLGGWMSLAVALSSACSWKPVVPGFFLAICMLGYSRVSYARSQKYQEILTCIALNDLRYLNLNVAFFNFKREQHKLFDAPREKDMYEKCIKETEKK
jgi:hypothetical protein